MDEKNKNRLSEEIERLGDLLKTLDPGSDEYRTVRDQYEKMYKLGIADFNAEVENGQKYEQLELEDAKMKAARKADKWRFALDVGKTVGQIFVTIGSAVLYNRIVDKTLHFEETGTVTSFGGRNVLNQNRLNLGKK